MNSKAVEFFSFHFNLVLHGNLPLYKACLSVSQGANLGKHLLGFS